MEDPREVVDGALRSSLERIISTDGISTVFQPIVDMRSKALFGYEALSRGAFPFHKPGLMFDVAERCGLSWDLDRACRITALRTIAELPAEEMERTFFINVSPRSITDGRAVEGLTLTAMKAFGIQQERIVIEVTESASIADYAAFEEQIRHYARQGYRIALDDFGSGHSGLLTLVAAAPHFIKLDRGLVGGIDRDPYRQKLISAVAAFAANVGTELLGEGIERAEEMRVLADLGVRFGQGFFLGRPEPLEPQRAGRPASRRLCADDPVAVSNSLDVALHAELAKDEVELVAEIEGAALHEDAEMMELDASLSPKRLQFLQENPR